jgi:hypothetical protein
MRAIRRLVVLAALPLMLVGCDVLAAAMYSQLEPGLGFPPDPFVEPGPGTIYDDGRATVEITQDDGTTETHTFDRLAFGDYNPAFGASVSWANDDDWELVVSAYDLTDSLGAPSGVIGGDVSVTRMSGFDFQMAGSYLPLNDGNSCTLDTWVMTEKKFEGRANCTRIRWTDGLEESGDGPTFDMTITFVATSRGDSVTS